MGKLLNSILLVLLLVGSSFILPTNASANTVVSLDGGKYVEARVLIPMRSIFEQLGATVEYNADHKTITAISGDKEIILSLWSDVTYIDGLPYHTDVPAQIDNDTNRTLVPLRFVSEALGATVQWNQQASTASVYSKNKKINVKVNTKAKINNDINIYYSIDSFGNIHANYNNYYRFTLVGGQKVNMIQGPGAEQRTLLSGMSLDFHNVKKNRIDYIATGYKGETEVTIIPNHWDWELAYYYYFYR
jgi:Copper amine oxidase N-terminal domain